CMLIAVSPTLAHDAPGEAPAKESLAFPDVYAAYFQFAWRSARALGVSQAAIDDVVQEIFVAVHRQLGQFEGRSTLRTWISGIVLNVVRRHRRTTRRRNPHELQRDAPPDLDELQAADGDPEGAAELAEGTRLLQRILAGLTEEKREILVLAA